MERGGNSTTQCAAGITCKAIDHHTYSKPEDEMDNTMYCKTRKTTEGETCSPDKPCDFCRANEILREHYDRPVLGHEPRMGMD